MQHHQHGVVTVHHQQVYSSAGALTSVQGRVTATHYIYTTRGCGGAGRRGAVARARRARANTYMCLRLGCCALGCDVGTGPLLYCTGRTATCHGPVLTPALLLLMLMMLHADSLSV